MIDKGRFRDVEQHLGIGRMAPDKMKQPLDGFDRFMSGQSAADQIDFFQLVRWQEEFFAASAAFEDVDGGVDVTLGDFAIEHELHVTGSLKFLENELIRLGIGFDQGRAHDGQAAGFAGVAGGSKESPGQFQRACVNTAGHRTARSAAHDRIVAGAGQPGDGIKHDEHVIPGLDEALGSLDGNLGNPQVVFGLLERFGGFR